MRESWKLILSSAVFALTLPAWGQGSRTLTCSSHDGQRHYCDAETRAGVKLIKQRSGSVCIEGRSWGYDDNGIWVDHGCRADFSVEPGPSPNRQGNATSASKVRKPLCKMSDPDVHLDSDGNWVGPNCIATDGFGGVAGSKNGRNRVPGSPGSGNNSGWDSDLDVGPTQSRPNNASNGASENEGKPLCGIDSEGVQLDSHGNWYGPNCITSRGDGKATSNTSGPAPDSGSKASCLRKVGAVRANTLVGQCLQVSPATHPPCNSQNSCDLITDEIKRGCGLLGETAPSFCGQYR